MKARKDIIAVLITALVGMQFSAMSYDMEKILNLRGTWKFSIGDNDRWADPDYDDSTPEATELGLRLTREFEAIFASKTTDHWFTELRARDIPCDPVRFVEEMITDEQVLANNYVIELEHHTGHKVRTSGPVLQFADGMPEERSSPALGAHTDEVLADIGYAHGEVEELRRDGSVN